MTRRRVSSSCRSASGWATTTARCSSSWPTRATGSTRTSTGSTRRVDSSSKTCPARSGPWRSTPRSRSPSTRTWSPSTLGYENRAIADEDFRDPRIVAGAIGAGHAATALYAIRPRDDIGESHDLGQVRLRRTEPGDREESRLSRDILAEDIDRSFRDTDETFKLDVIDAAAAEVLRESPYAEAFDLRDVLDVADESAEDLPQSDQVREFLGFLGALVEIGG